MTILLLILTLLATCFAWYRLEAAIKMLLSWVPVFVEMHQLLTALTEAERLRSDRSRSTDD